MNPEDRLIELPDEHNFDLVRQRKHKIYRNPNGMTFVVASTPSDWRASRNSLATLKRMLRGARIVESATLIEPVSVIQRMPIMDCAQEGNPTAVIMPEQAISEHEWETWKQQYWREEGVRAKNEKFLSAVSKYVGRVSGLLRKRDDVAPGPATDAIKTILRRLQYRSKVLIYDCKFFNQGVVVYEGRDQPILWASNGHIGISAFVFFGTHLQHGPSRLPQVRFFWEGTPVLFELPVKGVRKFPIRKGSLLTLADEKRSAT
jgi:hypothetical protein